MKSTESDKHKGIRLLNEGLLQEPESYVLEMQRNPEIFDIMFDFISQPATALVFFFPFVTKPLPLSPLRHFYSVTNFCTICFCF